MNRVIKFRVWHPTFGMMEPVDIWQMTTFNYNNGDGTKTLEKYYEKDVIFCQFTGLTDKSGKEIYESDIVKCHDHPTGVGDTVGVVEFIQGHYQVNGYALHDYGTAWTEVIGNKFEHPELLQEIKKENL
jgi:uncharacterized phage protein (TIGR01671 family)